MDALRSTGCDPPFWGSPCAFEINCISLQILGNSRIVGFIYCFQVVIVYPCPVMDMSFKDSLVALGLDEATGSPHFGGDRGRGFTTIPIEWSGSYREDLTSTTLTPGHTQWVHSTPRSFIGTVRREGSH